MTYAIDTVKRQFDCNLQITGPNYFQFPSTTSHVVDQDISVTYRVTMLRLFAFKCFILCCHALLCFVFILVFCSQHTSVKNRMNVISYIRVSKEGQYRSHEAFGVCRGGMDARQQKGIRVRVQMVGIHQSFTTKVFLSF